jgi:hypothetical protein
MANDDRKQPAPAQRPPAGLEPIKVRQLRVNGPGTALPPPGKGSMLTAGTRQTGETVTIQYEPWQRHHRVRAVSPDGKVMMEVCIPESWVAYTPDLD